MKIIKISVLLRRSEMPLPVANVELILDRIEREDNDICLGTRVSNIGDIEEEKMKMRVYREQPKPNCLKYGKKGRRENVDMRLRMYVLP